MVYFAIIKKVIIYSTYQTFIFNTMLQYTFWNNISFITTNNSIAVLCFWLNHDIILTKRTKCFKHMANSTVTQTLHSLLINQGRFPSLRCQYTQLLKKIQGINSVFNQLTREQEQYVSQCKSHTI